MKNHFILPQQAKRGTVLIIAAGISALLAMMALVFLSRMRTDAEESNLLISETRMRVMYNAALNYILETSRIGWDQGTRTGSVNGIDTYSYHTEAYGWVDVRNGLPGPRDRLGRLLFEGDIITGIDPNWPAQKDKCKWPAVKSTMRCDVRLWRRPPTAIAYKFAINPVPNYPGAELKSWAELVSFKNLDPIPALGYGCSYSEFLAGDPTPNLGTDAPGWFRIFRKEPAVFIITAGGGDSAGFRNWEEVVAYSKEMQRSNPAYQVRWSSQSDWEMERIHEPIMWYEVEWNPAVCSVQSGYTYEGNPPVRHQPMRHRSFDNPRSIIESVYHGRNFTGTFLYTQRLEYEPDDW